MRWLSKSRIQSGRQCHKRLWLELYDPARIQWGAAAQARLDEGTRFGELAQMLLGGGELVSAGHLAPGLALEQTASLLAQPIASVPMLFEPAFAHDGVRVRVDAFSRTEGGDTLIEVKSTTKVKREHLWDCAIQTWVARGSGRPVTRVKLGHVNTQFVYERDGDYQGLLQLVDITHEVEALLPQVPGIVEELKAVSAGVIPAIEKGLHCTEPYACPFFNHCSVDASPPVDYPLSVLPWGGTQVEVWARQGYRDARDLPDSEIKSPLHRRVIQATRSGEVYLSPALPELLSGIAYPRSYLDLETIRFVVPRWLGLRPFQQIPFQYSLHTEQVDGSLTNAAFLDASGDSPLTGFVQSLLDAMEPTGPVIVWNQAFEASRLKELAQLLPEHGEKLLDIVARMVDLLPLYRRHYYHRDMRGSWSIKAVLPTVAPDLSYDTLRVSDGGAAQVAYLRACDPLTPLDERDALLSDLLLYCERDTLAMVRLVHAFDV